MKKIISLILSLMLMSACVTSVNVTATEKNTEYKPITAADEPVLITVGDYSLAFDFEVAGITVTDNIGKVSYSSVPRTEITGLDRAMALSMLCLTVMAENGEIEKLYSYSECVTSKTFEAFKADNSLKVVYFFEAHKIELSVTFSIASSGTLTVSIPVDEIKDKDGILLDIALMPYFAAAENTEEGYMLIPDGSGALIDFDRTGKSGGEIEYSVYGTDALQKKDYKENDVNSVNLPMYALCYSGEAPHSVTAYVSEVDALASLTVSVSTGGNPYNTAYFTFNVRPYTLTTLLDRTSKAQKLYLSSKNMVETKSFTVDYRLTCGEGSTLRKTAEYVADFIFEEESGKTDTEYPLFLDVYMNVYKQVYTLGIPHNSTVPLTSLEDCMDMAELSDNTVMLLRGLDKYGVLSNKISSNFTISQKFGDFDEYQKLQETAEIYALSELTRFDKQSLFCNSIFHSARSVTGKSLTEYSYNPATLLADEGSRYLLRASKINGFAEKYASSLVKKGAEGVAPVSLGNSPYTDNKRSDRQKTADVFKSALKQFTERDINVLLENPDGYAIGLADRIISLPTGSSGHRLIDSDLPFIQMVIGKYIVYSTEAVNLTGDMNNAVLDAAATGSALCFAVTGSNYSKFKDTNLDYLYSADFSFIKNSIKALQTEYSKRMNPVAESSIIGFEIPTDGISCTYFENGYTVIVNRTNNDYKTANGNIIKANDYQVLEG